METAIHLVTKETFQRENDVNKSQLIIHKLIESCIALDISIFEPFMNEEDIFEDKEKYDFLPEIRDYFHEVRKVTSSNFVVTCRNSVCEGCIKNKPVKHFQVFDSNNIQKREFAFAIQIEDGILKDIYRCFSFEGCKKVIVGGEGTGYPAIEFSEVLMIQGYKLKQQGKL